MRTAQIGHDLRLGKPGFATGIGYELPCVRCSLTPQNSTESGYFLHHYELKLQPIFHEITSLASLIVMFTKSNWHSLECSCSFSQRSTRSIF